MTSCLLKTQGAILFGWRSILKHLQYEHMYYKNARSISKCERDTGI